MNQARRKLQEINLDPVDIMVEIYEDCKTIQGLWDEQFQDDEGNQVPLPSDILKIKLDAAKSLQNAVNKEDELIIKKVESAAKIRALTGNNPNGGYIPKATKKIVDGKEVLDFGDD